MALQTFALAGASLISTLALAFFVAGLVALETPWARGLEGTTVAIATQGHGTIKAGTEMASVFSHIVPEIIDRTHVRNQGGLAVPTVIHSRFVRYGDKRSLQLAVDPVYVPYGNGTHNVFGSLEMSFLPMGYDPLRDAGWLSSFRSHPYVFTVNGVPHVGHALTWHSESRTSARHTPHQATTYALWSYAGWSNATIGGTIFSIPSFFMSWTVDPTLSTEPVS